MKQITINGKAFNIGKIRTLKAIMIFEAATERPFEIRTLTDSYLFYYLVLQTNNTDVELEFDEFLEWAESDTEDFKALLEAAKREDKQNDALAPKKKE